MIKKVVASVALTVAVATALPASAAKIIFSGSGTVSTVSGRLTPTGAAPLGTSLSFSFSFDPEDAKLFTQEDVDAVYDLSVEDFRATLGEHSLGLNPDPLYVPAVVVGRGFSFFGQPFSEPVITYSFYLPGLPTTGLDPTAPFVLSPGSRETLSLTASFRTDTVNGPYGFDLVRDPQLADRLTFTLSATDPSKRAGGSVQGSFSGAFTAPSSVPEPSSWMMMIIGFGVLGFALRRRTGSLVPMLQV